MQADQHMTGGSLLEVRNLQTHLHGESGTVRAVEGVSFSVAAGGTLGIVGESGCGKSVTALSIMRLLPPRTSAIDGEILYRRNDGTVTNLARLDASGSAMRALRGNDIAMIFQEPMSSLNPVYSVGDQIAEAVRLHQHVGRKEARSRAIDMLDRVGIPDPGQRVDEYPHQLSGGMRQRVMIAIALSCAPRLLIADEPTTALDVTVQAQILDLIRRLQAELGMALIIITHDLGVVREVADEVAVMYFGRIVERGRTRDILSAPSHPYTQGLIAAIPRIGARQALRSIGGTLPPIHAPRLGCDFASRCGEVQPVCREKLPELLPTASGQKVRCWMRESHGAPVDV